MHKHLGKLSDEYLEKYEPILYKKIINLFNGDTIKYVSSWADTVKNQNKYKWTKSLHYIDILECRKDQYTKEIIDYYCKNECIITALQDFTNSIKYNFKYDYIINNSSLTNIELLKFLFHFLQDFSQPMHLLGYDRGGNDFNLNIYFNGYNKSSNLHFIWDTMLPEYFIENYSYSFPLNNIINKPNNYYKLLEIILNNNVKNISCHIYPNSHYIIFNDYFKDIYFKTLFDNYYTLLLATLKYIFQ